MRRPYLSYQGIFHVVRPSPLTMKLPSFSSLTFSMEKVVDIPNNLMQAFREDQVCSFFFAPFVCFFLPVCNLICNCLCVVGHSKPYQKPEFS